MNEIIFEKRIKEKKIIIEKKFNAPLSRVWEAWSNSKVLKKWLWPKTWPATILGFEFVEGWNCFYYMKWPDWTKAWWLTEYLEIKNMEYIKAKDSFSDAIMNIDTSLPSLIWNIRFKKLDKRLTQVSIEINANEEKDLKTILDMGFEEGYKETLWILDKLLE
jgi:uncharacterized protein YndB with AHSA1/START domain